MPGGGRSGIGMGGWGGWGGLVFSKSSFCFQLCLVLFVFVNCVCDGGVEIIIFH